MNPKATQYANSKVPNPDRNDAPYYTSRDRWQDVYEAYEAGEKGSWVSVEDGLPDENGIIGCSDRVLCLTHTGKYDIGYTLNGEWFDDMGTVFYRRGYTITHWQVLPAKPPIQQSLK